MVDRVTANQTDNVVCRTSAHYATPTTNCCVFSEDVLLCFGFPVLLFRPWPYSVFSYRSILPATSPGVHDTFQLMLYFTYIYIYFSCFFVPFVFLSVNACGILIFVCRTCRTQYDGTSFQCILRLLPQYVVSLCRGFVTAELVSSQEEESAQTLGVLDVDSQKERSNVKNAQTSRTPSFRVNS